MAGDVIEYNSPSLINPFNNVTVNVTSEDCLGGDIEGIDTGFASSVWTANLLVFVPLITCGPVLVNRFFWMNGAAVDSNTDVGIYDLDGTVKLGSTGSTVNSGTNTLQIVDVADFYLPPGRHLWLALGSDSSVQTYFNTNLVVAGLDFVCVKQQAAGWSSGLPSSITPAIPTAAKMPLFGFSGSSVV